MMQCSMRIDNVMLNVDWRYKWMLNVDWRYKWMLNANWRYKWMLNATWRCDALLYLKMYSKWQNSARAWKVASNDHTQQFYTMTRCVLCRRWRGVIVHCAGGGEEMKRVVLEAWSIYFKWVNGSIHRVSCVGSSRSQIWFCASSSRKILSCNINVRQLFFTIV